MQPRLSVIHTQSRFVWNDEPEDEPPTPLVSTLVWGGILAFCAGFWGSVILLFVFARVG